MSAGHTPLPWTQRDNDTRVWLVGADGVNVTATSWHQRTRSPHPLKDEAYDNIALIARAVNAHDALVACLDAAMGMVDGRGPPNWDLLREVLKQVRQP